MLDETPQQDCYCLLDTMTHVRLIYLITYLLTQAPGLPLTGLLIYDHCAAPRTPALIQALTWLFDHPVDRQQAIGQIIEYRAAKSTKSFHRLKERILTIQQYNMYCLNRL